MLSAGSLPPSKAAMEKIVQQRRRISKFQSGFFSAHPAVSKMCCLLFAAISLTSIPATCIDKGGCCYRYTVNKLTGFGQDFMTAVSDRVYDKLGSKLPHADYLLLKQAQKNLAQSGKPYI